MIVYSLKLLDMMWTELAFIIFRKVVLVIKKQSNLPGLYGKVIYRDWV